MSADRHRILIVEDDREFATMLDEMLSARYDVVSVASAEQALPLIREGNFCLLVLDQQILPKEGSKVAVVEAGQDLLEVARSLYPNRNAKGKHHLQILVMSGHARTVNFAVRAMQDGADDFIQKPLSDNDPDWRDKIRNAIRHSGRRDNHAECDAINTLARAGSTSAEPERDASPFRLSIPGTFAGKYTDIDVGSKRTRIPNTAFLVLIHLVALRQGKADGWLDPKDFSREADPWRRFNRLRDVLRPLFPVAVPQAGIQNEKSAGYRIHPDVVVGSVNWQQLETHPEERVQSLAKKQLKKRDP